MKQFIIIAHDAKDEGSLERRMKHRAEHLENIEKARLKGQTLCGLALVDENDKMYGSVIVANFPSRAELDEWLKTEPFITHKVWGEDLIKKAS
jgi:uncharacterized protein YciI